MDKSSLFINCLRQVTKQASSIDRQKIETLGICVIQTIAKKEDARKIYALFLKMVHNATTEQSARMLIREELKRISQSFAIKPFDPLGNFITYHLKKTYCSKPNTSGSRVDTRI